MSKSSSWQIDLVEYVFQDVALPTFGSNLYVALHTASPGEGGNQQTNEAAYTGYGRLTVARTSGGWTIASNSASNTADLTFGTCTASPATVTHFSVGTASTGTGQVLFYGALTTPLVVAVGTTPRFVAGSLVATED